MRPLSWIILLLSLTALVWLAALVFRHGTRRQFISSMPAGWLLFYSVGAQVAFWLLDWLTADPDAEPFFLRLATGAVSFAAAATIWLSGLFYGRWRKSRREGVLKGR